MQQAQLKSVEPISHRHQAILLDRCLLTTRPRSRVPKRFPPPRAARRSGVVQLSGARLRWVLVGIISTLFGIPVVACNLSDHVDSYADEKRVLLVSIGLCVAAFLPAVVWVGDRRPKRRGIAIGSFIGIVASVRSISGDAVWLRPAMS